MGNGLKALVAITCAVVIAAIGYFFWQEYRSAKLRAEQSERAVAAHYRSLTAGLDGFWCRDATQRAMKITDRGEAASLLPDDLWTKLEYCVQNEVAYPYEINELRSAGLLDDLKGN